MCLAIPMQLVSRRELDGVCELRGVRRTIGLMLVPEAKIGDHVLVHAGYAIGCVDAEEAARTLELLDQVMQAGMDAELPPGTPPAAGGPQ